MLPSRSDCSPYLAAVKTRVVTDRALTRASAWRRNCLIGT